jgi:hypothetical protein
MFQPIYTDYAYFEEEKNNIKNLLLKIFLMVKQESILAVHNSITHVAPGKILEILVNQKINEYS